MNGTHQTEKGATTMTRVRTQEVTAVLRKAGLKAAHQYRSIEAGYTCRQLSGATVAILNYATDPMTYADTMTQILTASGFMVSRRENADPSVIFVTKP